MTLLSEITAMAHARIMAVAATVAATPVGEAVSGELFSAKEMLVALLATYVAFFGWLVKTLSDLRTEFRTEIKDLRTEVTSEIKELRGSIQSLTTELARMQGRQSATLGQTEPGPIER